MAAVHAKMVERRFEKGQKVLEVLQAKGQVTVESCCVTRLIRPKKNDATSFAVSLQKFFLHVRRGCKYLRKCCHLEENTLPLDSAAREVRMRKTMTTTQFMKFTSSLFLLLNAIYIVRIVEGSSAVKLTADPRCTVVSSQEIIEIGFARWKNGFVICPFVDVVPIAICLPRCQDPLTGELMKRRYRAVEVTYTLNLTRYDGTWGLYEVPVSCVCAKKQRRS